MASGFAQRFKGKIKAAEIWFDRAKGIWESASGVQTAPVWTNAGSPTNGGSGTLANIAQPGDLLVDTTNKALYQNTNTSASPTWTLIESSGGAGSFTTLSASGLTQLNGGVLSPPAGAGATKALTSAQSGSVTRLDQDSGSVVTLPAATGSGATFPFVVTVTATSAKHAILAASSSDNLIGFVTGENAGTAKCFAAGHASGFHSLQMPFAGTQPSGGFEGDWFDLTDIAANTWAVSGCYQAGTTPTTPFNTGTS